MTDKEKRVLKDGVKSIFKRFNILDHTASIGDLRDDILRYIDSLQEEPVSSIWHDASEETPTQGSNILMVRKEEKDTNYPPIAGCFHGTNSRLDGRNWGYYNGFCYNEIEPPVKWAYIDDILNLSNVERTEKNWKEPVSEELEEPCNHCQGYNNKEKCDELVFGHNCPVVKKPVNEDLEEASVEWFNSVKYKSDLSGTSISAFKAGARWQKRQMMKNAVDITVGFHFHRLTIDLKDNGIEGLEYGDKVKLIIIKQEEE